MNELNIESTSATFYYVSKAILTPLWHDKNVTNHNSKLYYVLEEELIVETNDVVLLAKSRDMILIPAGVKYDFYLSKKNMPLNTSSILT